MKVIKRTLKGVAFLFRANRQICDHVSLIIRKTGDQARHDE